ncbi:related to sensory transduction histidine kinase [Rhynchosporium graminicola]|uniref:Related to sensory transduction histidine kinase n=1 Tax=Rhynchosporium graminicola TaxID=2792576 RepID=A0A1E1JS90_9HELO|nr:related to sensory transduction histidine kinase [Rhynchosporium commune]
MASPSGSRKHARSSGESTQRSTRDGSGDNGVERFYNADDEFAAIPLGEFLELDPRPTFALKTDSDVETAFTPVFLNASLRSDRKLMNRLPFRRRSHASGSPPEIPTTDFQGWVNNIATVDETAPTFLHAGILWTSFRVKRWVIVSGCHVSGQVVNDPTARPGVSGGDGTPILSESSNSPSARRLEIYRREEFMKPRRIVSSGSDNGNSLLDQQDATLEPAFLTPGTPDWTVPHPEGELSDHVEFARSIDWAATPLGDMKTWSREFRQIACLLMAHPFPLALFWGAELTVMYNKAYAENVAGLKHPELMGTGFSGPFKELWSMVSSIFDECRITGKSVAVYNQMLPIERQGFVEETFYTWSLTPLYGGTDHMLGLLNSPFETTRQTRGARAMKTLLKLAQETATAKSVAAFWPKILSALSENDFDFPFVMLYSVAEDEEDISRDGSASQSSENSQTFKTCALEGTIGIPDGHPSSPQRLDLKRSYGGFVPAFRDSIQTREPTLLTIKDGTLSETLMENFELRGFGEPCREALVCPIRPTTGENVLGFLVVGVNPRKPFDDDYQNFIHLLDRQLATSLASVMMLEAEVRRGLTAAEAAALERSRLSEELAVHKSRLQRIAEVSPVGMFSVDAAGLLLEGNDRWFEMTGHSRDKIFEMSWVETVHDDSIRILREGWKIMTVEGIPWSAELQLKKPWYDNVTGDQVDSWIIAACQPEFWDGKLKTVMGSMTDISRIKWAENLQARRLLEAEETRRAQNNFIDITSHEMRNPLSAILQCADGISSSLSDIIDDSNFDAKITASIKESIANAETIQLCAQHQKSIVDDILTISKLDSNLLLITPVPVQPVEVVQQALQMFMVECQKVHDIKMGFHINPSFKQLHVDMVTLDSSRLLQVLINLMTNAIKFTKSCAKRTIDVSIGAYLEPPEEEDPNFQYFPTKKARMDVTTTSDWGDGDIVYLRFEVRDSGCGLTPEEIKRLFNRFSQASPRTHVQYGGSGLGLFISRQITELQGGEIGVASQEGIGSTFAFYIKARRADTQQPHKAIQKRVGSELQSKARLVLNKPKSEEENAGSMSTLLQLRDTPPLSNSNSNSDPTDWHILIVEDNLVNQRILAQQIRKLGSTIHVANHGGEALDLIKETRHFRGREHDGIALSVILMDLEMPVMDGLTCVRKIREMEAHGLIHGRLPIIAVTANARGEQIALARDSGMDDVMPKPFRILQIRTKIEAFRTRLDGKGKYEERTIGVGV